MCLIAEVRSLTIGKAQKNLSQTIIKEYKIPLPTLEEQEKVVKEINIIEEEISLIEKELKQLQEQESEVLKKYL